MRLIRDLGVINVGNKSERRRCGIYECPICFKEVTTQTRYVNNGKSTKCKSCRAVDTNFKHGLAVRGNLDENYTRWTNMKDRCYNPNNDKYERYGGRGIKVCDEWKNDYVLFQRYITSLKNANKEGYSIDRIDNDGDYEYGNIRWSNHFVQTSNTVKLSKANKSGYRGVYFNKQNRLWSSKIRHNGNAVKLGNFDYPWTAAYAYDSYVLKNNTEHTRNFK